MSGMEKVRPIGDLHSVPHFRCGRCHDAIVVYNHDKRPRKCKWCGVLIDWSRPKDICETPEQPTIPIFPTKTVR